MITVRAVADAHDWAAFRAVPGVVYRDDPWWIPGATTDLETLLIDPGDRLRARTQAYVAFDSGAPVGRIVAIADHRYNELHSERAAFFGFYETVPSDPVAVALLDAAAAWARARSLSYVYGPVSPSVLYSAGMLVSGGDRPALVGMPHNPVYYADQVTRWGMRKVKDLHSYRLPPLRQRWTDTERAVRRWQPPAGITFRTMDVGRFEEEVDLVRRIYNAAFEGFWGYTPAEPDEFLRLATGFGPALDADLVVFAEVDGEPVGYLMAFPDLNQRPVDGSQPVRHARIDMLAVHPKHQDSWIGSLLIFEMLRRIYRKGFATAEAAPILEDASWPRSVRGTLTLDRVYRVYGRELTGPAAA